MQAPTSLTVVGVFVALVVWAIAMAVFASALLAVPLFLVGLGILLMWRGKGRATQAVEQAVADPTGDSGVSDASRSSSSHAA